jgi:hypothetical protein
LALDEGKSAKRQPPALKKGRLLLMNKRKQKLC